MTITFGPKRKNRYFIISYGVKKIAEGIKQATPGAADAVARTIPISKPNGNGNHEMTFATLTLTVSPDEKTSEKTPHVSRNQVADTIMKHHPDCNYLVIMNVIEMQEKDFLQWNG